MLCWQVQSHPGMQGVLKHIGCGLRAVCARHVFNHVGPQQHVRRVRGWQVQLSSQHPRGLYLCPVYKRDILACWCCQLHCVSCGDLRGRFGQRVYGLPCWEVRFEWGQRLHRLLGVRDRPVQRVQLHCFGGYRVRFLYNTCTNHNSKQIQIYQLRDSRRTVLCVVLQWRFFSNIINLGEQSVHWNWNFSDLGILWHPIWMSEQFQNLHSQPRDSNSLHLQRWFHWGRRLEHHMAELPSRCPAPTPCQLVWRKL